MCEIMTIAAACLFTALYFTRFRTRAVFTTMLMFWGAALMWSVDCVCSLIEGGPLLDLSREDAVLGVIVIVAGLSVFAVLAVRDRVSAAGA